MNTNQNTNCNKKNLENMFSQIIALTVKTKLCDAKVEVEESFV